MRLCALILVAGVCAPGQPQGPGPGVGRRDPAARQPQQRAAAAEPEQIRPEDKCTIEGVVYSTGGEALKKANLTLRRIGGGGAGVAGVGPREPGGVYQATTNSAGAFQFTGVDPGRYNLSASRTGFVTQSYGSKGPRQAGQPITLAKAQRLKDASFKLIPHGVITGRVLDDEGDPIVHAQVQAMQQTYARGKKRWSPVNGNQTNDLGEYRLFGLAPGKYLISASHQSRSNFGPGQQVEGPDEGFAQTFYPGAVAPDMAAPIEVTPGSSMRGADIRLMKVQTVRVRGWVIDGTTNEPVRNATVMLIPRSDVFGAFAMRNAGRPYNAKAEFVINGVQPGSYSLVANSAGQGRRLMARMPIEVGATPLSDVVVTLSPGMELAGAVKVEGIQGGAENVRISVEPKNPSPMGGGGGGQVKPDGSFTIAGVAPDEYYLNVGGIPETMYVKSIRFGDSEVFETGIDLSRAAAGPIAITLANGAGQVSGTVQSPGLSTGAALTATVALIPEGARKERPMFYRLTNVDQTGAFALKGLYPGEYRIYAFEQLEAGAHMDPDFMKQYESNGERVVIKENAVESIQLKLIPPG